MGTHKVKPNNRIGLGNGFLSAASRQMSGLLHRFLEHTRGSPGYKHVESNLATRLGLFQNALAKPIDSH